MRKMFMLVAAAATVALFAGVNQADAGRGYHGHSRSHSYRSHSHGSNFRYRGSTRYYAPRYGNFNRGYVPYRGYAPYYRGGRYYGGSGIGIYTPGFRFSYWR